MGLPTASAIVTAQVVPSRRLSVIGKGVPISQCRGPEAMRGSAPYPRGWSVGGTIQVVRLIVIAYFALLAFALVGYFLTVVLLWFLKVVVPMAWP